MKTAERVNRLGIENAFEVLKEVQKLEAQGKQIISFAIGEPDFDTPEHIKEACVQALRVRQSARRRHAILSNIRPCHG